jgi:ubiquinone/menaquinone biosynthesis C-methylase UbiE
MPELPLVSTREKLTKKASLWVAEALYDGAIAVDATVGNGYDTLFLAQAVGPTGQVIGFDIQKTALNNASELLRFAGTANRVRLILSCHSALATYMPRNRPVSGAMFNLGFLPRGDRRIATRPETTLPALEAIFPVLDRAGRLSILTYRQHVGGEEEYIAVRRYLEERVPSGWQATEVTGQDAPETAPRLFLVRAADQEK